jgi:hypothetical protein
MQDCFQPQVLAALLPGKTPSPGMLNRPHSGSGHDAIETIIVKYI